MFPLLFVFLFFLNSGKACNLFYLVCAVLCSVASVLSDSVWLWLSDSMDCSPPDSSVHGILRQEHRNGLPCSPPGDLPDPEMKPTSVSSALQADSLLLSHQGSPFILFLCFSLFFYIIKIFTLPNYLPINSLIHVNYFC